MTGERRSGVRPLTSELVGLGWAEPHQYVEESRAFARDHASADVRG